MPTDLNAQFWRACDILRRDDNTQGLLDYAEQISWLLFLKSFEDLEDTHADEAAYERRKFERVIDGYYRWSVWTSGRVEQARSGLREAESALRAAQKALLTLETDQQADPDRLAEARAALRQAEGAVKAAAQTVELEQQAQRAALRSLFESAEEDDRKMAEAIVAGLTGKPLLRFLEDYLFPHLRELTGAPEREVVRQIFEETPSKMVKDGVNLRDAIAIVDTIDFHAQENLHTLSALYENLLVRLGREGGMAGELYTPRPIIRFIVQMVDPRLGETVFDPAGGSMGFPVEAYGHMLPQARYPSEKRKLQQQTFYGQEKKPLAYLLGVMNCVLHGISAPRIVRKNSLGDDVRKITERDRRHVVLTNPPFGGTENIDAVRDNFRYPSSATSILFLQYIMAMLRRDGRVGMVIDEGVLFKTNERAYVDTKKELLEDYNLYAIVSLPAGVFANVTSSGTGPKTDLLFFNHLGPTKQVWYYEVRAVGFSLTRTQKPVEENDLPDCLQMWHAYDEWLRTPIDQRPLDPSLNERCWIVSMEELGKRNYDLSARNPNRLNDFAHRPPEELMADIADKHARFSEALEEIRELLADESVSTKWPRVPLAEVLAQSIDVVAIKNTEPYKQVTVRLHSKGLVVRQEVQGEEIKTKRQFRIRTGQFVYSRIDARNGAMGLVTEELDNAIVSNDFPVFDIDVSRLDPQFLSYYTSTASFIDACLAASSGTTNRRRLKEVSFLKITIPLPSIEEQQRIVSNLHTVRDLQQLQSHMQIELDALLSSMLDKMVNRKQ